MKLTGYYMTAICKFEDGIKTICVVDAQNRAQMLERLKAAYPEQPFKLYDFVRTKFSANVQSADVVDINNKLKEILEKLIDFFENFVDEMAESKTNQTDAISHLQTIEQKQDTMIDLLRTIAANTTK